MPIARSLTGRDVVVRHAGRRLRITPEGVELDEDAIDSVCRSEQCPECHQMLATVEIDGNPADPPDDDGAKEPAGAGAGEQQEEPAGDAGQGKSEPAKSTRKGGRAK